MVRSEYPTRFAATKFVLMLTFFEHTLPVTDLGHAGYLKPGPQRRNYTMLDLETRRRMAVHVQLCARRRRRCTVKALIKASGQESSLHAFRERFPLTRQFLKDFRASPYAARRIRPDCAGELGCITPGSFRALVRRLIQARETSTLLPS